MKKIIATIGWLLFASASFGEDGQHTGVGGNPVVPPSNPSSSGAQSSNIPRTAILPGLLLLPPEFNYQDAATEEEASRREQEARAKAGHSSAQ